MIRADSKDLEGILETLPDSLCGQNEEGLFSLTDPEPALIVTVKEKPWGTIGYLVVDTLVCGKCSGGIRMAPDVSEDEVVHLARAMTLKFAFKNSALGGAKSGIIAPADANEEQKQDILKAFGRHLGPFMKSVYSAGGDIGVGADEVKVVKRAAGLEPRERPADYKAGFFTAFGVFASAKTIARELGIPAERCRIAIEGYGNVGRPLLRHFERSGFKTVGLSTIRGALYNPNGLVADELEKLAAEYGDRVVEKYNDAEKIANPDLFKLDVDILIPGARPWCIRADNADGIRARAVVTAANIPVTREAALILSQKGIAYVPDFVSTGGGILGCSLANLGFNDRDVLNIMEKTFATKLRKMIALAKSSDTSVEHMACRIAKNNFLRLRQKQTLTNNQVKQFFSRLKEEKSLMPMIERAAIFAYKKTRLKSPLFKKFLEPFAVSSAYRNAVRDVKYYPGINP